MKKKHRNRMSELRKKRGLTQKQVAAALGIGESSYCSYENASREPNYQMLIRIADFFGVSLDYLLNHKINGTDVTISLEDLEILEKYDAMSDSARNLVNLLMNLVRDYESQISRSSRITVSSGADSEQYARMASRDGDGIREEPMTPEQLQKLQELEDMDENL
ncbi:MAG: helix-turn-helix domain-containing protein [Oscillospiraceae bacterium]|nr:helix-turn-helix domain-containing protein [Oscillospiraceae bacterium]